MRTRLLWALVLPLALLLAGCSGGDDGGGGSDGPITLRFQSLAWQEESVEVNKELVKEWNATHPDVKVEYVQGSWDSVHDQLLTSFEGGEAPDIIHDASDDLADFAYGGYLADLTDLLPQRLKSDIPQRSWETATFGDGIYGVPFLQEPRVLIANAKWLKEAGVRIPTPEQPWSWAEFRKITEQLSGDGKYGVAWPLKEPVSASLNLSLSAGGQLFHRGADGKVTVRFEPADEVMPSTVHDQVITDRSASPTTLGSGGSDTLPGFFGGRYAMVPLGFSYRQQIVQQAPKGFDWQVLPAPAGADGLTQGVSPQTLSIAEDSPHQREAAEFIDFLLRPAEHGPAGARRLDAADRDPGAERPGPAHRRERLGHRHGPRRPPALGARAVRAGLSGVEGQGRHARLPGVLQRSHRARRTARAPGGRREPGTGPLPALTSSGTAALVDRCLRAPALTDATLLTQLEYARKRPGDHGSWTRLTVLTRPRYAWRLIGRVGRHSFRPVPRVDAGIVRVARLDMGGPCRRGAAEGVVDVAVGAGAVNRVARDVSSRLPSES